MNVSDTATRHFADDRFQNGKHDDTNTNNSYECKFFHIYTTVKRVILTLKQ